jgi:hypothetical protein
MALPFLITSLFGPAPVDAGGTPAPVSDDGLYYAQHLNLDHTSNLFDTDIVVGPEIVMYVCLVVCFTNLLTLWLLVRRGARLREALHAVTLL